MGNNNKVIKTDNGIYNLCGRYCTGPCGEFKTWDNFYAENKTPYTGFRAKCKDCLRLQKGSKRKVVVISNELGKTCTKCEVFKPWEDFYKNKGTYDKHNCWCNDCKRAHTGSVKKKKFLIDINGRECSKCGKFKLWENFVKTKYTSSGYASICKKCKNIHAEEYRKNNHEDVLSRTNKHRHRGSLYKTYAHKLTVDEDCKEGPQGELLVKCANSKCNSYFNPSNLSVQNRIAALNGRFDGEGRLYCGDECKKQCPIFNNRINLRKDPTAPTSNKNLREYSYNFTKMVLEVDGRTCQMCGKTEEEGELIVHHIDPYKKAPMERLDILNVITLCKECHNKLHTLPGCSRIELSKLNCEFSEKYENQSKNIHKILRAYFEFNDKSSAFDKDKKKK
jgi:hypothetical protein